MWLVGASKWQPIGVLGDARGEGELTTAVTPSSIPPVKNQRFSRNGSCGIIDCSESGRRYRPSRLVDGYSRGMVAVGASIPNAFSESQQRIDASYHSHVPWHVTVSRVL